MLEQQELDLRELLLVVKRRLPLIVALPVVAAIVSALISLSSYSPVYQASTTLWIIKEGSQITNNDVMLNRNLTKTYAEVAKSRAVMADVITRLDLKGMSAQALQGKLTVTPVKDTEILSFTVQDGNPAMAAKLANAMAESFKAQITNVMKVENVVVVDAATEPTAPIRSQTATNVAVAFALGLIVAIGFAFLLEYLDTSIKSPEDLTGDLGMTVLAVIPAFKTGVEKNSARKKRWPRRTREKEEVRA